MELKLYIDTANRKLVKNATSDFPVTLPKLFREDTVRMTITLLEPTGNFTEPMAVIDIADIDIAVGIGTYDQDPEVLQETWTKDTAANTFTADVTFNTTELNDAFDAGSGDTLARVFEIEVERSTKFHTVLHESVTLSKDIIVNPTVPPSGVTSGSAFANSFAATVADSETIEWTKTGDYNYAHILGTSALTGLTASKFLKTNAAGTGFELGDSGDLLNKFDATTGPTTGDDAGDGYAVGSFWVDVTADTAYVLADSTTGVAVWLKISPTSVSHTHSIDDLDDVDTSTPPTSGQVLGWNGSEWAPATNTSPNLWATFTADSGTTSADSTADTLTVIGGAGIDTTISADVLTIAGEDASTTNKGIASFDAGAFTVASGAVGLQAVGIVTGGTGATTKEDAFDNLSPTTTEGDMIFHDGSDNISLDIGTAGDSLRVDSTGATPEWQVNKLNATTAPVVGDDDGDGYSVGSRWVDLTAEKEYVCLDATTDAAVWTETTGGGSGGTSLLNKFDATTAPVVGDDDGDGYEVGSRWVDVTADKAYVCLDASTGAAVWTETTSTGSGEANEDSFKTITVSGQSDVVADNSADILTLVAGTNLTITSDAATDTITFSSTATGGGSGGGSAGSAGAGFGGGSSTGDFLFTAQGVDGVKSFKTRYSNGAPGHRGSEDPSGIIVYDVYGDGNFIYFARAGDGIASYSVDMRGGMTLIDTDDQGGTAMDIWADGVFLYLANDDGGLVCYEVDDDGNFTLKSTATLTDAQAVWGDGDVIYVACGAAGIASFTVSSSGTLSAADTDDAGGVYATVWCSKDYIYCVGGAGVVTYSADSSGNLTRVQNLTISGAVDVWGDARWVYVTTSPGVTVYEAQADGSLTELATGSGSSYLYMTGAGEIRGDGDHLFVARNYGITVLQAGFDGGLDLASDQHADYGTPVGIWKGQIYGQGGSEGGGSGAGTSGGGTAAAAAASCLVDLCDTPSSFGTEDQILAINAAEDALEWVDPTGAGGGCQLTEITSGTSSTITDVSQDGIFRLNIPALGDVYTITLPAAATAGVGRRYSFVIEDSNFYEFLVECDGAELIFDGYEESENQTGGNATFAGNYLNIIFHLFSDGENWFGEHDTGGYWYPF